MQTTSLDVISIGGATRDIFFGTSEARVIPSYDHHPTKLVAFEYGKKIIPEEVYLTQGGGGHNSSTCFARLGLKAGAVLSVGDDGSGHRIQRKLAERYVDTALVRFERKVATALSVIVTVTVGRDHIAFLFRGANDYLDILDWSYLESARWLYVTSLTGHGASLLPKITELVRATGNKLALNPGSLQLKMGYQGLKDVLESTSVLIVNYDEACRLARSKEEEVDENSRPALLHTLKRMGPELVVMTQGRDGSCALDSSGTFFEQAAYVVDVHDTTGAGDAYGSALVAGLILGFDVPKAMRLASMNGAAVVTRLGATEGLLSLPELERKVAGYGAA